MHGLCSSAWLEHLIVTQKVAGSNPVRHPLKNAPFFGEGRSRVDRPQFLGYAWTNDERRRKGTMKTDTNDLTVIDSNVEFEGGVDMSFDPKAFAHLTNILTKLYNDADSAVFREYVANGIDAHIAAGNTDPIEVWLPTDESPMFMVVDRGTGMTRDRIAEAFQFGTSFKNESNDEIGGFGLGCKSGLAIASQFTLSSVKNGVRTIARIHSREANVPRVDWLPMTETDEGNGTTVSIPVSYPEEFNKKALKYLPFFARDTVKIMNINTNGYESHYTDLLTEIMLSDISDGVSIGVYKPLRNKYYPEEVQIPAGFRVVMGGISYTVPQADLVNNFTDQNKEYLKMFPESCVIVEVPIGYISLSPNREGIQFDTTTINVINDVFNSLSMEIVKGIEKEVEEAGTFIGALSALSKHPISFSKAVDLQEIDGITPWASEEPGVSFTPGVVLDSNDDVKGFSNVVRSNISGYYANTTAHNDLNHAITISPFSTDNTFVLVYGSKQTKFAKSIISTYNNKLVSAYGHIFYHIGESVEGVYILKSNPSVVYEDLIYHPENTTLEDEYLFVELEDLHKYFGDRVKVVSFQDIKTEVQDYRKSQRDPSNRQKSTVDYKKVTFSDDLTETEVVKVNLADTADLADYDRILAIRDEAHRDVLTNGGKKVLDSFISTQGIEANTVVLLLTSAKDYTLVSNRLAKIDIELEDVDFKEFDRELMKHIPVVSKLDVQKSEYAKRLFSQRYDTASRIFDYVDDIKDKKLAAAMVAYIKVREARKQALEPMYNVISLDNLLKKDKERLEALRDWNPFVNTYYPSDEDGVLTAKYPLLLTFTDKPTYSKGYLTKDWVLYMNAKHAQSKSKLY